MTTITKPNISPRIEKLLSTIESAWKGHEPIAGFLLAHLYNPVIVDLGVDLGYSTIALASLTEGHVYGIDWFKGDSCVGNRDTEEECLSNVAMSELDNITIIKSDFTLASKMWNMPIDLLHIDGDHSYEAIDRDFYNWRTHVKPGGFVLIHDICSYPDTVGRFVKELDEPCMTFSNDHGLAVIVTNND